MLIVLFYDLTLNTSVYSDKQNQSRINDLFYFNIDIFECLGLQRSLVISGGMYMRTSKRSVDVSCVTFDFGIIYA